MATKKTPPKKQTSSTPPTSAGFKAPAPKKKVKATPAPKPVPGRKATTKNVATPKPVLSSRDKSIAGRTAKRVTGARVKAKTVAPRKVFTLNARSAKQNAAQQTSDYRAKLAVNQLPVLNDAAQRSNVELESNRTLLKTVQDKLPPELKDGSMTEQDKNDFLSAMDPAERQDVESAIQQASDLNFTIGNMEKRLGVNNALAGGLREDLLNKPADTIQAVNPLATNGGVHNSNPNAPAGDMGVIEQQSKARIAGDNNQNIALQGAAETEQYTDSKGDAQTTMSNTGMTPGFFDGTSFAPPENTALKNNPNLKKKASAIDAANAAFNAASAKAEAAYKEATANGSNAGMGKDDFWDAAAEEAKRDDAIAKAEEDSVIEESDTALDQSLDTPTPDSFLASLDAAEQQMAGTEMAPIFDLYREQYKALKKKDLSGTKLIDAVGAKVDSYVADRTAERQAMEKRWDDIYTGSRDAALSSARRTYQQQRDLANIAKDKEQQDYNRAIREQIIQNEEDRQSLLLDNGISGGWRSSMHTGNVIRAMKQGESIVADLESDRSFAGAEWERKKSDIIGEYHGNITAAYDTYNVSMAGLQDKLSSQAAEIDKTVFTNDIEQLKAIDKLSSDWFDGVGKLASSLSGDIIKHQETVAAQKLDASQFMTTQQGAIMDDAIKIAGMEGPGKQMLWDALVTRASAQGLSLSSTPPDLLTYDQQQKNLLKNTVANAISMPGATHDGLNYGYLGTQAWSASKWSDKDVQNGISQVTKLVSEGRYAEAGNTILNAVRQGMDERTDGEVSASRDMSRELGLAKSQLTETDPDFGGLWRELVESGKPLGEFAKNEQYTNLKAHLSNVLGTERHNRFGAALTDTENAEANKYFIDFSTDTAETIKWKMEQMNGIAIRAMADRYDQVLGAGSYSKLSGTAIPTLNFTPSTGAGPAPAPTDEEGMNEEIWKRWPELRPGYAPPTTPHFNQPQSGGATGSDEITQVDLGGRKVKGTGKAIAAMQQADAEFFAAHGEHIFVNSSFRSQAEQQAAWERYQRGEISRAAPPGQSLHEEGNAFDITNYKLAEPYLIKYGFHPLPANIRSSDPAHFSYGMVG